MANWRDEYFAALGVRDEYEQANASLYDAYTQLADRTARVNNQRNPHPGKPVSSPATPSEPFSGGKKPVKGAEAFDLQTLLSIARKDLSEAQKSRSELLEQLKKTTEELEKLKKKSTLDSRKIADLAVERTQLQLKLRDRDEELRGKAKLLEDVQDELVSLNLQFNMAEERAKKLGKENKELVDRWMARIGQEADEMNRASKFS